MNSYIIVAVKVDGDIDEAMDTTTQVIRALHSEGFGDVTLLNTIPAP